MNGRTSLDRFQAHCNWEMSVQKTTAEIAKYLLAAIGADNLITGGERSVEDSRGNFTVEKQDDKVTVCVYDNHGVAWIAEHPITGSRPEPDSIDIRPDCQ